MAVKKGKGDPMSGFGNPRPEPSPRPSSPKPKTVKGK
jgi:hypothetical protein